MFAFSQIPSRQTGVLSNPTIDIGTYLGSMAEQGYHDSLFGTVSRMTEDSIYAEGEMLKPDEANRRYGIPGQLMFDEPLHANIARLRNERKRAELLRENNMRDVSLLSGRGMAGLGVSMVASISNPLDLAAMFMPITGSLTRAKLLAETGAGAWRQALAKGLITEEAIAASKIPLPGMFSSVLNGVGSQLAVEIPLAIQNNRDKANYGIDTFAFDLAAGGVFAAGMHGLGKVLERAFSKLGSASPETRETMFRQALQQVLRDEQVRVADLVKLDETKIAADVNNSLKLKALASLDLGKLQAEVADKYREKIVSAALKYPDGTVLEGPIHIMIDGPSDPGAVEGFVTDKGRFIDRDEAAKLTGHEHQVGSEDFTDIEVGGKGAVDYTKLYSTTSDAAFIDNLVNAGESPDQAFAFLKEIKDARAKAADEYVLSRPEVQAEIARIKEERIKEFVDKNSPDELKKARDEEIKRQIQDGKILSTADAVKWEYKTSEEAKTALDEEIATLEKDLQTLSPDEVKSLDEAGKGFTDKVIGFLEQLNANQDASSFHLSLVDIPLSLRNGAIDTVIGAIKIGKKVTEAIEFGAQHLRDKLENLPDREGAAQLFKNYVTDQLELERQHLAEEATQVEASNKMALGSGDELSQNGGIIAEQQATKKVDPIKQTEESIAQVVNCLLRLRK